MPPEGDTFGAHAGQFTAVAAGGELTVASFGIRVHGSERALVDPDIPRIANVGYLADGSLSRPGDAFFVPEVPVPVLPLPTSGPWLKIGAAADYPRSVRRSRSS